MKDTTKTLMIALWAQRFRALFNISARLDAPGVMIAARRALWTAKLAKMGSGTQIHPFVVIHGAHQVRIGARCSIAEFVQM